jgi:hypothetical protein
MATFRTRMLSVGTDQTRPEGGAPAPLGPARPSALAVCGLWTTIATSTIGSSSADA